ncbi:TIGR02234 family membrane protein [Tsukamurella strandjordii]|uniref:TIGR02234 family membrane protein n=1 Tax=Tsukamurella TaxID=2060 RepID=UPI001C7D0CD2|nr:TIGR02234 family membrane protein [Tsukamurella sp. TY48]GIZ98919.1 membrane protein [Tsukamurella sp. TY48]
MKDKRGLLLASVLLLLAAIAVWGASRMTWMRADINDFLSPGRTVDIVGHTWASALTVLPLVFLAAIAAALAVKGWARVAVAVVVAAAAIGSAFPAIQVITQEPDVKYIETILELAPKDIVVQADKVIAGPLVAVLGGVLAVAAATLLLRGQRGGGMDSKYSAPAARRAELEKRVFETAEPENSSERDLWDALDSGDDPTEGVSKDRPEASG